MKVAKHIGAVSRIVICCACTRYVYLRRDITEESWDDDRYMSCHWYESTLVLVWVK
jgi:hypothetical protein